MSGNWVADETAGGNIGAVLAWLTGRPVVGAVSTILDVGVEFIG